MPEPHAIALFAAAALALLVIPGPSVLYIVTRSIEQGRTAGLVSVLGVHAGTLFHVGAAAFGLSAILVRSAALYTAVKWAGAAYLVVLGVRRLATRAAEPTAVAVARTPLRTLFRDGVVVNALNPKTALFFFAFLPQFVDHRRGSVTSQVLVLGAVFVALGMLSDGTYALTAAHLGSWLKRSRAFRAVERYVAGGIFVTLGVTAALAGSKPSRD
ncbi:MAG TPA: LysE family translocator [Acidimicrobiales bacterium]|nr:LysE family translocator [Acidimicrobiales bacterium]